MTEQHTTPAESADEQEALTASEAQTTDELVPAEPVPGEQVTEEQVEVGIQRSVRFGRLIIVGAFIGAVIAVILTLLRPVDEEALYEMRQIAGFMLVIGATFGVLAGALLGLILNIFAKRRSGSGVAVHTDVQ